MAYDYGGNRIDPGLCSIWLWACDRRTPKAGLRMSQMHLPVRRVELAPRLLSLPRSKLNSRVHGDLPSGLCRGETEFVNKVRAGTLKLGRAGDCDVGAAHRRCGEYCAEHGSRKQSLGGPADKARCFILVRIAAPGSRKSRTERRYALALRSVTGMHRWGHTLAQAVAQGRSARLAIVHRTLDYRAPEPFC